MRFDPFVVTVKRSFIVYSQICNFPVVLSQLVLLESVNKSFVRCRRISDDYDSVALALALVRLMKS